MRLVHLTRPPDASLSTLPAPLLLLLHGVGSHEEDLFGLVSQLDLRFFVVSARAPLTLGPHSYGWFHVTFTEHGPVIVPEEAEASRQTLIAFIDELIENYHLDPHRVYLMGFSQGAIMSLSLALTAPEKIAGVVAMSGRILPEVLPLAVAPERMNGLPIFVVHGLQDNVLPIHHGRASRDRLSQLPVALTYKEYDMGHQISADSLSDISNWLAEQLNR